MSEENKIRDGGTDIFRIAGGKIAETWTNVDMMGMMRQIGAFPSPEQH